MKQLLIKIILNYFRFFARLQLKKNPQAVIIGVTGSAGKTSTARAISQILLTRGRVKTSRGSNSESGIPFSILGLKPATYSPLDWFRLALLSPLRLLFNWEHFNFYVVEMGIDSPKQPKNMAYLLSIVHPDVGVILNSGLAHANAFDYLVKDHHPARHQAKLEALIAREKMQLAHGVKNTGVVVYNLDQPQLLKYRSNLSARQFTFGKSAQANLRILRTTVSPAGFKMAFCYQGQTFSLAIPDILPLHFAYTLAAAAASALAIGIPPTSCTLALAHYRSPAGRARVLPGLNNSSILDSSYNASPGTMRESLELLNKIAGRAHTLAVVGDMRELGDSAKLAHKNLADWLVQNVDEAILFGPLTGTHTLPVLLSRQFPARHFTRMSDLTTYLHAHLTPKSWILVKGSQNEILLERAVESLLADPKDINLLCRRGSYWDQIRSHTK